MRILLIEDDKRLAGLIRKVLESEHFTVDTAHDGDLGLEIALRGVHDVAIIDWMLPGRDGPAVCRAIRARAPLTGYPHADRPQPGGGSRRRPIQRRR